ncbi:MAG: hypothetical protein NTY02_19265, partial [Acidobacteria bacterium]|nr:hypothetical protein [Acidobacteriota bacterium]
RDLILARLEGGPLAKTGVIAGMSGSPVYIDGRLVGAVSYSIGQFATEPIAGITPIAEMMRATFPAETLAGAAPEPIPVGADIATLWRAFQGAVSPVRPYTPPPAELARLTALVGIDAPASGNGLRPIAVPLAISGFDGGIADPVLRMFQQAGFVAVSGSIRTPAQDVQPGTPLRPGDPVGVALISGDMQFGATGTVTEVVDGKVYAFGHPLYNLGPTRFVMTRAYVHAVLPSLASSMKLASIGEPVGTFQQDRATAIAGTLGPLPDTVRVTVSLQREGGARRVFTLGIVDDALLTPLLTYTALANIVSSHERDFGPTTYALRGRATVAGHGALVFDDVYAGDQPGITAAAAVVGPIGALMTNDRERIRLESVELDIQATERLRVATIERVWFDATTVRRGQTVPVKVLLKTWRGDPLLETVAVEIPLNAEGPLTLLVASGPSLAQFEQRETRSTSAPTSVDQTIRLLNQTRRGNRLYVRLLGRDMGAVVNGEAMPALPSSVLAVLQGDLGGSAAPSMQPAILGAWDLAMGQAVVGMRTIAVPLDPAPPRP